METTNIYEIIFLAIIAGVIIYRLHSVLGTRPDNDTEAVMTKNTPEKSEANPIEVIIEHTQNHEIDEVAKEAEEKINKNDTLKDKFSDFKKQFPNFNPIEFTKGAKAAFEVITEAFTKGNLAEVKDLVSDNVYHNYENIIDERNKNQQVLEFEIIRFVSAEIKDTSIDNGYAKVQINFATEQVNVLKDKDGAVLSGSDSFINNVNDLWTFVKDINSENPNWILVAAKSG